MPGDRHVAERKSVRHRRWSLRLWCLSDTSSSLCWILTIQSFSLKSQILCGEGKKKKKVHQSEWPVSWEISVFLFIMGLVLSIQMPGFLEGQSKCKRKHPSKKEGTSSKKKWTHRIFAVRSRVSPRDGGMAHLPWLQLRKRGSGGSQGEITQETQGGNQKGDQSRPRALEKDRPLQRNGRIRHL